MLRNMRFPVGEGGGGAGEGEILRFLEKKEGKKSIRVLLADGHRKRLAARVVLA